MLKKQFVGMVIGALMALPAFGAASKSAQTNPSNWVPFPWAQELPFTWSTAQGVWKVGSGSATSYFYIRVSKDKADKAIKFLSITERDGATCEVVATGFGTEEDNKRIVADMKYVNNARARYHMILRLYDPKGVPQNNDVQPFKGKVMVLTIMPLTSNKKYNYPMTKLSDRTEYPCTPVK